MKRMKRFGLRHTGGKRGFTLIELLIVMVILAILAGIVIISVGGVLGTAQERAYYGAKDQVKTAVGEYMTRYYGDVPSTGDQIEGLLEDDGVDTTATGVAAPTPLEVIDVCSLLVGGGGILLEVPVSAYDCVAGAPALCSGNASGDCSNCLNCAGNCSATAHYTWLVTGQGDVYSVCTGADCQQTTEDGFQGLYP